MSSTAEQLENGRRILRQMEGRELSEQEAATSTSPQVFPNFWDMHLGHLFGEVFTRTGITLRERLMVN
ncbi:hypothetical protein ACFLXD_07515, partial [Chloroflexota bacterium]